VIQILLLAISPFWLSVSTPAHASLRGLAVPSKDVIWASGTEGTWLLSTDAGAHWRSGRVPGAETLDFRDIAARDAQHALLLASGAGVKSRIYQTNDAGEHWTLLFENPDPQGFFDAFDFWDRSHGILLGDPVDGHFAIFTTQDGGQTWQRQTGPRALADEGAFAASGTCLATFASADAWFGTGGSHPHIFHSSDRGRTWTATDVPLGDGSPASGVFSLFLKERTQVIAVGGNYTRQDDSRRTLAVTENGSKWLSGKGLSGYRSAVAGVPKVRLVISVGTNGSDISQDGGRSWSPLPVEGMNAVAASPDGTVWAAGAHGAIARLNLGH
jgi:photosystem II stability/assembly factor-like uncharacterized protein